MADTQSVSCGNTSPESRRPPAYGCCDQAQKSNWSSNGPICDWTGIVDNYADHAGAMPDVVPYNHPPFSGGFPGDPSWGSAALVIPWTIMSVYGDAIVARKQYPMMRSFIDFLTRHGDPKSGGLVVESQYGDFAHSDSCMSKELNALPNGQAGSFSYLLGMTYLVDIANATGQGADVHKYSDLLRKLKAAYHTQYWNASSGNYGVSIAADVFALHLNLVPATLLQSVNASLIRKVKLHLQDPSRSGGVVAWRHLLQVLLKLQQPQLAIAVVNSTLPGTLGHMLLPGQSQTTGTFWWVLSVCSALPFMRPPLWFVF